MSPYFVLLFFLILFSITANDGHPICNPFHCGNNSFSYPFWLNQDETKLPSSHCGDPELMITCKANTTPILRLSDAEYVVTSIDPARRTIHLVDAYIGSASLDCPRPRHNLTLDVANSSLSYTTADSNLTFFVNCTSNILINPRADAQIDCLQSGSNQSYVFLNDAIPPGYNETVCEEIVVVPVLLDEVVVDTGSLALEFDRILDEGFELQWDVAEDGDCHGCERSQGGCEFACFCHDGSSSSKDCNQNGSNGRPISHSVGKPAESKSDKRKKIAIVVSAAGAGLIAVFFLVLFLYKRKKRQQHSTSSTLLYRSTSSELSSKKDPELGNISGINYQTHIFSYDELQEATNAFDASRELGDGGFGTVYKGKLRDGRIVAVKRLYESNYKRVEQFMNEVVILSRLRHQNLVTLYGCTSRHSRELLLVYEFVPNGTVADHLHGSRASEGGLTWPVRMSIAIETADALAYLHAVEPQIIHRDVKTNNILLDNSFHVKVADFGLSRLFPLDATHVSTAPQGTPGYVDPEYHQCYQLTDKSDVYSFGVVLMELISSMPAVDITRHRHEINLATMAMNKIQNQELDKFVDHELGYHSDVEVKRMITQVAELAFRCLQMDREMRPNIKEVLEELRGIEIGDAAKPEKVGDADVPTKEESRLLKNFPPYSPDSVADRWGSMSTTPNTNAHVHGCGENASC